MVSTQLGAAMHTTRKENGVTDEHTPTSGATFELSDILGTAHDLHDILFTAGTSAMNARSS